MASKNKLVAVLTGDIIGSRYLSTAERKAMQTALRKIFDRLSKQFLDFKAEEFRGDGFQAILSTNRNHALRIALLIQTALLKKSFDIRIGIGIGNIAYQSSTITTSDGSAFQLSGPILDDLKKRNQHIGIAFENINANHEWSVHTITLNFLIEKWSALQSEAIHEHLTSATQQEVAEKLNISQPSVHQRLQTAGWPVIDSIVKRFENYTFLE
jgi:hypothetical protein